MTKSTETLLRRPRRRLWQATAATGVAAVLSLGGVSAALAASAKTPPAAPGAGRRPGLGVGHGPVGTVAAIGASSVTITNGDGTSTTYTTTASTTYEKDGKASSASALAVGSIVSVLATSTSSTPTASEIDIFSPSVAGTVVSASGSAITVQDQQGFWHTINVSGTTSYELGGQSASASAVTTGERVMAVGAVGADHTSLDATDVQVVLPSITGRVTAISGSTITLTTRSGTATVTTTASTVYRTKSGSGAASDVKVGAAIVAEGEESSSTAITATSITVVPAPSAADRRGAGPLGPRGGGPGGPGGGGPGGFGGPAF